MLAQDIRLELLGYTENLSKIPLVGNRFDIRILKPTIITFQIFLKNVVSYRTMTQRFGVPD
jgi:hypothetical protein